MCSSGAAGALQEDSSVPDQRLGAAELRLRFIPPHSLPYGGGNTWADQYRASRTIPFRHNVLGKAYGWGDHAP